MIRNCQHYGQHCTLVETDAAGDPRYVTKKAMSREGADALEREHEGINWYCRARGKEDGYVVKKYVRRPSYCELSLSYVPGKTVPFSFGQRDLMKSVTIACMHYLDVFGSAGFKVSHGDFFVGNIIYDDEGVAWVMDWEHFNNTLPAGFDAVFCVVEPFLTAHGCGRPLGYPEAHRARELLSILSERTGIPGEASSSPAMWCRKITLESRDVWGKQYSKLPQVAYGEDACISVDRSIGKDQ